MLWISMGIYSTKLLVHHFHSCNVLKEIYSTKKFFSKILAICDKCDHIFACVTIYGTVKCSPVMCYTMPYPTSVDALYNIKCAADVHVVTVLLASTASFFLHVLEWVWKKRSGNNLFTLPKFWQSQ